MLNDRNASDDRRDQMAKAAAPYIHPRLAAFDIKNNPRPVEHSLDLTKLTDDELRALERIVAKSQRVTVIENDDERDAPSIEYDDSGYKR